MCSAPPPRTLLTHTLYLLSPLQVSAPVFQRIAKTNTKANLERERAVRDDMKRMEEEHRERVGVAAPDFLKTGEVAAPLSEEAAIRLAGFLDRQAQAIVRKEMNIEAVKAATAPQLQPALCQSSIKMIEKKDGPNGFLERLRRGQIEKETQVRVRSSTTTPLPRAHAHPAPPPPIFFTRSCRGQRLSSPTIPTVRSRLQSTRIRNGFDGAHFRTSPVATR